MTEIIFKSLFVKNFLSIGKTPLELSFSKGINLITGENKDKGGKNGIGKSTIADSIFWCLFGNTIRELKKENIQHNLSKDECFVILNFDIKNVNSTTKNYQIKRTLNPAKIEILCDKQDITLSTLPKNDEFIVKLINANEEVFNNAVIMSTNNTIPFMAQKKTEKRKFIEGILQLNIFGEMLLKTRSEYNDTKKQNDIECNNFINLQKSLEVFEQQFKVEKEDKEKTLKNWEYTIESNLEKIQELKNNKFPDIEEIEEKIDKLETEKLVVLKQILKKTNADSSENNSKKYTLIAEIKNFNKEKQKILDKGNTCPTCNREYCKDDIDVINDKIKELNNSIKEHELQLEEVNKTVLSFQNKVETIEDGIDKVELKVKELNKFKQSIAINKNKIHELENHNKIADYQIKEIQKRKDVSSINVDNYKKQIEEKEVELKEIKKELSILDSVKFILSEDGVKTYIVKKIITFLNEKLNFYLQKLETPCKCVFDETFEETIYNESGKEVSYFNFSGGERKRIDTAILFTFQDVLRFHSGTSFSLNIYDELFDCALDTKGTDKVLDILKEKTNKYNESIYIVSHKNSEILNIENVIFLEKHNGATIIKH
jgi:DNA repair exonuclease SbcCD ATPase subunit